MDPKQINKMQRVQNLLKKGRENLNRSRSELGDHNRKILQQLTRHRSDFGEQNKRLLASFRMKEIQSLTKLAIFIISTYRNAWFPFSTP